MEVFILASQFLWLIPIVCAAANNLVELSASNSVAEPCHSSVTLRCNISQEEGLEVNKFYWIRKADEKTLCSVEGTELMSYGGHRILCNYTQRAQLALTITQLWPSDGGEYLCKLRANLGVKYVTSEVKVQECFGDVYTDYTPSKVACHFHDVYPQCEVHWFHRGENVTSSVIADNTSSKSDLTGMYNVSSVLQNKGGSDEYNCSLWNPDTGTYLTSKLVPRSSRNRSGANGAAVSIHIVGLGWLLLLQARVFIV